jgi:excisionase family DNA binding protein
VASKSKDETTVTIIARKGGTGVCGHILVENGLLEIPVSAFEPPEDQERMYGQVLYEEWDGTEFGVPHEDSRYYRGPRRDEPDLSTWLTVKEATGLLRCGKETVYRLIRSGRLIARRLDPENRNSAWRISRGSLNYFLVPDRLSDAERAEVGLPPRPPNVMQYARSQHPGAMAATDFPENLPNEDPYAGLEASED